MAVQTICSYNKLGHCKYGETCRNQHVNEMCENPECDVQTCNYRHPRECRWYREFCRCKFGDYCSYSHNKKKDNLDQLKMDNTVILEKLSELEKTAKEKDKLFDNFVTAMLEKFRKLEEKVFNFDNHESEIELTFFNPSDVEKSCDDCNFKTYEEGDLENHVEVSHEKKSNDEVEIHTIENECIQITEAEVLKCDLCDFQTKHQAGLKSHKTKIHGQKIKHPCDQCEETFENRKKLKSHIYCIHSGKYKTMTQLIDECNP